MMRRIQISLSRLLWPAAALLAGLVLTTTVVLAMTLSASPSSSADVPGGIEGILYDPDGVTPVEGGWIDIYDANEEPWMGVESDPDGYFSIPNLPPGAYFLRAYPPKVSIYAASAPTAAQVLSGQWTSVTLRLTEARISGYVRDRDAYPEVRIEGAFVVAHGDGGNVEAETDVNGEFKIGGVMTGTPYRLEAFPPPESEYVLLESIIVTPTIFDVVLEMYIPPTNVVGAVHDSAGNPVPGAWIVVSDEGFWNEAGADELGDFFFRGLPPGEFWIHAGPPWGEQGTGLTASEPFTIHVTEPPTVTDIGVITLPHAYKTVTGRVVFEGTGGGVPEAEVRAWQLDGPGYASGPTDPTGAFILSLTGGEWHVGVEPLNRSASWVFPGPPAWVAFDLDTTPQTETVTLEVIPTNAGVTGHIVCPGGVECPGDPPHWAIWVELRNDEIRNGAELGTDYRFEIPIPDGWYELVVHVEHPELQGPRPLHVFVGPGQTLDVGNIELLEKNARIVGWVHSETGQGVAGVPVVAWQPDGWGWGWAETNANGVYTMPVIGGEWFVEPQPRPEQPYIFRGHPRLVRVAPGGTMRADFWLIKVNALIRGIAADAQSGERLWGLDGWAWAQLYPSEAFFSDAPMREGGFALKVRGEYTYTVGLHLPPQAPYVSDNTDPVPIAPGDRVTIVAPLEHKDAAIEGQLIDVLTGAAPNEPVWAEVFGEDERGHWVSVGVDPDSAEYHIGVISGTWRLRAWVDPTSGYVALPTPASMTVQSGQVVTHHFEVWPIAATISGQVFQPNGTPLSRTVVFAEGESPFVGRFETHAKTNESGNFALVVPAGNYLVGAALPGDKLEEEGWLHPQPIEDVATSVLTPATGLELRFRKLDGSITGAVSFAAGIAVTPTHPAYVWGWSESGEWAEVQAFTVVGTNTFTYTMRVVSDTVWHVGAVYEDWDNGQFYESAGATVQVPPSTGQATQSLTLAGPCALPQPIIVSFDGTQMQTIVLPDGVKLDIPPRALVVSGTVTLYIFPTQELRPEKGREIIGAGYEIWATDENGQEITQFNKNVVATFHYPPDAVLAQKRILEHLLVPVYYSTLVERWILADSYTVDTVNNEITLQLNHFTRFGAMSTPSAENNVYLPLVLRNYGG